MKRFFRRMGKYFRESYLEMRKVTWPSKDYVWSATKVVIVSTLFFALFLGFIDFLLLKGIMVLF